MLFCLSLCLCFVSLSVLFLYLCFPVVINYRHTATAICCVVCVFLLSLFVILCSSFPLNLVNSEQQQQQLTTKQTNKQRELLPASRLRPSSSLCPPTQPARGVPCVLSYVWVPPLSEDYGPEAAQQLRTLTWVCVVLCCVVLFVCFFLLLFV